MELTASPLFGIVASIAAFELGVYLNRRTGSPVVNPLLVAIALVIALIKGLGIPLSNYQAGGQLISLFLGPATAVLALSIYSQLAALKRYFLPVVLGCLAGALTSMLSVLALCRLFGLSGEMTASLLPKSVTTPIAMEVCRQQGGVVPVTVAAVIVTGILGAVLSPALIRLFRIGHPVAQGVAIGAASHAVGTTKAVELGEVQGAMSGIAIGISGLITVVLAMFL